MIGRSIGVYDVVREMAAVEWERYTSREFAVGTRVAPAPWCPNTRTTLRARIRASSGCGTTSCSGDVRDSIHTRHAKAPQGRFANPE
jgi:hypothetical protein